MLIPITSEHEGEIPEWVLVELQGRIEPLQEVDMQESLQVGTMQLSKTVGAAGVGASRFCCFDAGIMHSRQLSCIPRPGHTILLLLVHVLLCNRTRTSCNCR